MAKWAYNYSDEELLNKFWNILVRIGAKTPKLVIDSNEYEEAGYLRGIILSRIEQQKPPFALGNEVQLKRGHKAHSYRPSGSLRQRADSNLIYTVKRVFYKRRPGCIWELLLDEGNYIKLYDKYDMVFLNEDISFKDHIFSTRDRIFSADDFELAPVQIEVIFEDEEKKEQEV